MPRGKGVYVDDDDSGGDSHGRVTDDPNDEKTIDEKTPDVDKPEAGSEPPD